MPSAGVTLLKADIAVNVQIVTLLKLLAMFVVSAAGKLTGTIVLFCSLTYTQR